MKSILKVAISITLLCMAVTNVSAAELVMFDRKGCPWCAKWHAEIGAQRYNASREGQDAPLRIVDALQPLPPDLAGVGQILGTPTFVLIDNGRVIDRMEGYPGKEVFYGRLMLMLDKLTGADKKYDTIVVQ